MPGRKPALALSVAAVLMLSVGLLAAIPAEPARASDDLHNGTVRIGLVASLFRDTPEAMVQVLIRPFKSLMESQTGVTSQLITGGDADSLGKQLKDDRIQLGVFHGFEFAWARHKNPELQPLLIAVNEQRFNRAAMIVRKDCTAQAACDLHGKAVALPRLSREHCRLFLERRCVKVGQPLSKCFSAVTTPIDVEDALDEVVDGAVAGAVIDADAFANYAKQKPGRAAKLRMLVESEAFPCAVVAYLPGVLPQSLLERFRDGMIGARSTPRGKQLLELCRINRFEAVPADYDQMLINICKAYPAPIK